MEQTAATWDEARNLRHRMRQRFNRVKVHRQATGAFRVIGQDPKTEVEQLPWSVRSTLKKEARMLSKWDIVKEEYRYALVRLVGADKGTVVRINREQRQVYSTLDSDHPKGGGCWCSSISDNGIDYVSSPKTWRYARLAFARLTSEAASMGITPAGGYS